MLRAGQFGVRRAIVADVLIAMLELIVTFARSIWTLVGFVIAVIVGYMLWLAFPEWQHRDPAAILCFAVIFLSTLIIIWARGEKI
jgi:hypothetical protein